MICQYFTDTAALLIDTDFARGAIISCLTQYKAMRARPMLARNLLENEGREHEE
jgi:hypothetical protein